MVRGHVRADRERLGRPAEVKPEAISRSLRPRRSMRLRRLRRRLCTSIRPAERGFLLRLFIAAVLSIAAIGTEGSEYAVQEPMPLSRTAEKWQDMRATELMGTKAVDLHGEALGRIEDLIFASKPGGVDYAVVSFAARLGLGTELYTYPMSKLAPGRDRSQVVIEAERKGLAGHGGTELLPLWLRQYDPNAFIPQRRFVHASELIGKTVDNRDGTRAGEVEDLVVNLGSGRLRYVVAEIGGKPFALPLHSLDVPLVRERNLVLNVDRLH